MTMQMYDVKEWHDCDNKIKVVGHSIVIAESAEEAKQKYLEHYGSSDDYFIDNTHIEVYAVGQFYQLV